MSGSISRRPCDAVNVVAREPACSAPWIAPAAPASLCISTMARTEIRAHNRSDMRRRAFVVVLLTCALGGTALASATLGGARSRVANPKRLRNVATVDPRVAAGAHYFVQFACSACHGEQGRGG